jgi:hypothetical protein
MFMGSGRASNPMSGCEAADQRHEKQNEEYKKQDSGDSGSRYSDAPETKDRRYNRNHQEYGRPPEHRSSIGVGIGIISAGEGASRTNLRWL